MHSLAHQHITIRDVNLRIIKRSRPPSPVVRANVTIQVDDKIATGQSTCALLLDNTDAHKRAIKQAARIALHTESDHSFFDWWINTYIKHTQSLHDQDLPILIRALALIEWAALDAFCRATRTPFIDALRTNTLGLRLDMLYPELESIDIPVIIPAQPTPPTTVPHFNLEQPPTSDPTHHTSRVALQLTGHVDADTANLSALAIQNESRDTLLACQLHLQNPFTAAWKFREYWQALALNPALEWILPRAAWIEQPLTDDVALNDATRHEFADWVDRPAMIIDTSNNARLESLRDALDVGYLGITLRAHRGAIRAIAQNAIIKLAQHSNPTHDYHAHLAIAHDAMPLGQQIILAAALDINNLTIDEHTPPLATHFTTRLRKTQNRFARLLTTPTGHKP